MLIWDTANFKSIHNISSSGCVLNAHTTQQLIYIDFWLVSRYELSFNSIWFAYTMRRIIKNVNFDKQNHDCFSLSFFRSLSLDVIVFVFFCIFLNQSYGNRTLTHNIVWIATATLRRNEAIYVLFSSTSTNRNTSETLFSALDSKHIY